MKALKLLAAVSLAALAGATALPAAAQDKAVALKLAHWVPPSHPLQIGRAHV